MEPDWGALCRDPNFALFFESEAVERLVRESVKKCCEDGSSDEVQFHRGRLDAIRELSKLPELQVKRSEIKKGNTPVPAEAGNVTWRARLVSMWRRRGGSNG